jgi:hypothetical protein
VKTVSASHTRLTRPTFRHLGFLSPFGSQHEGSFTCSCLYVPMILTSECCSVGEETITTYLNILGLMQSVWAGLKLTTSRMQIESAKSKTLGYDNWFQRNTIVSFQFSKYKAKVRAWDHKNPCYTADPVWHDKGSSLNIDINCPALLRQCWPLYKHKLSSPPLAMLSSIDMSDSESNATLGAWIATTSLVLCQAICQIESPLAKGFQSSSLQKWRSSELKTLDL